MVVLLLNINMRDILKRIVNLYSYSTSLLNGGNEAQGMV